MEARSLKEVIRDGMVPGLPYRTAARWCEGGLVNAPGGGRQRVEWQIGAKELSELRTLAKLRQGLSLQGLRRAAKRLRAMGLNPFSSGTFAVIEGGELVRVADESEAVALIKRPGQCVLIALGDEGRDEVGL